MAITVINPYYKSPADKVVAALAGEIDALFQTENSAKSYTLNQLKVALPASAEDINKRNVIRACALIGIEWEGEE